MYQTDSSPSLWGALFTTMDLFHTQANKIVNVATFSIYFTGQASQVTNCRIPKGKLAVFHGSEASNITPLDGIRFYYFDKKGY